MNSEPSVADCFTEKWTQLSNKAEYFVWAESGFIC